MQNNRNFLIAMALSILVLVGWQFLVVSPRMEAQRQAELAQREAAGQVAPQNPGSLQTPQTPAGTPQDIVTRLNTEINRIIATPAFKERMLALGGDPAPMSPAQFHDKAMEDAKRFGAIIQAKKIVGD